MPLTSRPDTPPESRRPEMLPRARRTVPRHYARAALAAAAGLIFLGLAITATTTAQRLLGGAVFVLALAQAWRETRRASNTPRPHR